VDYIVSDWHTIHEDRTVGAQSNVTGANTGTSTSRLIFNHLLNIGSKDQLNNTFYGIGKSFSDQVLPQSVVVFDLDTFEELTRGSDYTVDTDNGAITFTNYPAGAHVRIFYHPADDWGVSVLKPAAAYVVQAGTSATSPSIGEVVDGDAANPYVLYFPKCDRDRQVQIDGTVSYTLSGTPTTATISQLVTVEPAAGITAPNSIAVAVPTVPITATSLTWNKLTVSGASLTVRVIWREEANWRHRDVTTVDVPNAAAA
jgi:hypothetical protein